MTKAAQAFWEGFEAECSKLGVDPQALVKAADPVSPGRRWARRAMLATPAGAVGALAHRYAPAAAAGARKLWGQMAPGGLQPVPAGWQSPLRRLDPAAVERARSGAATTAGGLTPRRQTAPVRQSPLRRLDPAAVERARRIGPPKVPRPAKQTPKTAPETRRPAWYHQHRLSPGPGDPEYIRQMQEYRKSLEQTRGRQR